MKPGDLVLAYRITSERSGEAFEEEPVLGIVREMSKWNHRPPHYNSETWWVIFTADHGRRIYKDAWLVVLSEE